MVCILCFVAQYTQNFGVKNDKNAQHNEVPFGSDAKDHLMNPFGDLGDLTDYLGGQAFEAHGTQQADMAGMGPGGLNSMFGYAGAGPHGNEAMGADGHDRYERRKDKNGADRKKMDRINNEFDCQFAQEMQRKEREQFGMSNGWNGQNGQDKDFDYGGFEGPKPWGNGDYPRSATNASNGDFGYSGGYGARGGYGSRWIRKSWSKQIKSNNNNNNNNSDNNNYNPSAAERAVVNKSKSKTGNVMKGSKSKWEM